MHMNLNLICQACLSSDRSLYPVSKLQNIIDELNLNEINAGGVCFECKTKVLMFHNFKMRIQQAQKNLKQMLHLKSLSTLTSMSPEIYYFNPTFDNANKDLKTLEETANDYCLYGHCIDDDDDNYNDKQFGNYNEYDNKPVVKGMKSFINVNDNDIKANYYINKQIHDKSILKSEDGSQLYSNPKVFAHDQSTNMGLSKKEFKESITDKQRKYIKQLNTKCRTDQNEKIECLFLTHKELLEFREKQKNQLAYKDNPYKCDNCIVSFLKPEILEDHLQRNHNRTYIAYICEICQMRFSCAKTGRKHQKKHYVIYKCKLCDYESNELWIIRSHYQVNHMSGHLRKIEANSKNMHSLQCGMCGERFKAKNTMLRHIS